MYKETYKGKYRIINPSKYKGDISNVIYRSSWELKFMRWCDNSPSILEWGSETVIIPYKSPIDNNIHRYFVDFYIKTKDQSGKTTKYLIEIKPEKFTKPPPIPQRQTKKFIQEVFNYGVNQSKWKAADTFCKDRGWKFLVLTEKELGIQDGKKYL